MGRKYVEPINDDDGLFICRSCKNPLTSFHSLQSTNYNTQFGEGYLFSRVVNITLGKLEKSGMRSGQYMVRKVRCKHCELELGWMYEYSFSMDCRFKEGQFVLAKRLMKESKV